MNWCPIVCIWTYKRQANLYHGNISAVLASCFASAAVRFCMNKEVTLNPAPVPPNPYVSREFELLSPEIKLL